MKKSLILIYLSVFFCAAVFAQENPTTTTTTTTTTATAQPKNEKLVSKKGIYILPEQGEFALGVDATPFFSYLGHLMSNAGTNSPTVGYGNGFSGGNAIYGKYMLEDNKAVRIRLGFTDNKQTDLYPVEQSSLTPDPSAPQYVNDEASTLRRSFYLAVGLEKHRGKSRIQGVYGAELFFGASRSDVNYVYGNSINNDFNTPAILASTYDASGRRLIEDNTNKSVYGGVRGFVGVEYFIAPKLSIGGEFGYSLMAQKRGVRGQTYEYWDGATTSVREITIQSHDNTYGSFKFIGLSTDNLSGSINLFLYF
jgi:hypothetical protein